MNGLLVPKAPRVETGEWKVEAPLERWVSGFRRAAAQCTSFTFPRLTAAALAMEAAHFRFLRIPHLFSQKLLEIDPSLNDELLGLYQRSEQVLSNRFTFLEQTESFEGEIPWESKRASSLWHGELHGFNYALDLALTYRITGEERHARHLRYLIAHWVAANPPPLGPGWRSRTVAKRVRNWILAADLAREDWEGQPEFLGVVSKSLALQTAFLLRHLKCRGSAGDVLDRIRALLVAGRFYEHQGTPGADLTGVARTLLFAELARQVPPDGWDLKPWPSAQIHLALTLIEWLVFNPEDLGGGVPDADYLRAELRKVLSFLEGMLLPDGTPPFFGSAEASWRSDFANVAALGAVLLAEPAWKKLADKFGIVPYMLLGEQGKARFKALPSEPWKPHPFLSPPTGIYRLCSTDSSALVVSGRPPGSSEDHRDLFGFELFVQGQRVIVDSGASTPKEEDNPFRSALAHNVLLVNGQPLDAGQVETLELANPAGHGARLGLRNRCRGLPSLTHTRAWFVAEQGVWMVVDRLEGRRRGHFVSLLHFYPTFEIQLRDAEAVARSRTFTVIIIPLGQPQARMSVSVGDGGEFPGWYAPDIGFRHAASVLALQWTDSQMPWVGGYAIVPGTGIDVQRIETDPRQGTIRLEISGKPYRLSLSSTTAAS